MVDVQAAELEEGVVPVEGSICATLLDMPSLVAVAGNPRPWIHGVVGPCVTRLALGAHFALGC